MNTIFANEIEHIICKKHECDNTYPEFILVKPKESICGVKLRRFSNIILAKTNIIYLPRNSSIFTTGHKLQGKITLSGL